MTIKEILEKGVGRKGEVSGKQIQYMEWAKVGLQLYEKRHADYDYYNSFINTK